MLISGKIKLVVSDFEESLNFYTNILGFKLKNRIGRVHATLQGSGMTIELEALSPGKVLPVQNFSIGVGVSNLDPTIKKLKEKNISFSGFKESDIGGRIAQLEDPNGVSLYLREIV
jgi:catechol 2,3-dioxygenase-like lactoylglutathione lyase family enzyme